MKKTFSFAVLHFAVAFSLAFMLTGDIIFGSLVAMIEPMVNTLAFYFHDRLWNRRRFYRYGLLKPAVKTASFATLHFSVAFAVAYALSGSLVVGGLLALLEPAVNTCVFYFHERAWNKHQSAPLKLHCHHQQMYSCQQGKSPAEAVGHV
ncbi:hypothetical protein CWC31_18365 [Pseudoalteromonas ruthenica]|nr:hypothetical protein CWC31_18365 [Pseudoalteromonas ruthenica]TMO43199.1 hypothetical protein CWC24_16660 [Pseudoalteromonas ruthenica]TMO50865.1 hypothetical protein CWC23_09535 [Pseudoalteromonas ruthenica]